MKKIISSVLVIILMFSLALTCLAADTTPSVEAKPAPELTPIDPENPDVIAQIKTSSDTKDVFKGALSIISLADKDTAPEDIKNNLTKTFDDINEGKLDKVIAKAAKAINKDYTSNNLIATDLFELSLSAEAQAELKNSNGGYISVKFKVAKAPAAVLHLNTETNEWIDVGSDNIIDNKDGTVTVNFSSLCPVIFLSVNESAPVEEPSNNTWLIIIICVIAVALIVIVVVCVNNSKKKSKKASSNKDTKTNK